jgi:hypothetical protein
MKNRKLALIAVVLGTGLSGAADAQTVYNTFGPGNSFDTLTSWGVYSTGTVATGFTVGTVGVNILYGISLALLSGQTYTVYLMTSVSGLPGTVIDSWTIAGAGTYQTLRPDKKIDFLPAGSYFVVATSTVNYGGWSYNNIGSTGTVIACNGGNSGPWNTLTDRTLPVMQVQFLPSEPTLAAYSPIPLNSDPFSFDVFGCSKMARGIHAGSSG